MTEIPRSKLDTLVENGVAASLVDKLATHLRDAPAPKLVKMAPPALAAAWDIDPDELLHAFLVATRFGVLELEWDIRCDSCFGSTQLVDRLSTLRSHSACPYCEIDVDVSFDGAIEVTFRPQPGIRDTSGVSAVEAWFARSVVDPVTAAVVQAGTTGEIPMTMVASTYHIYDSHKAVACPLRIHDHADDLDDRIELRCDGGHIGRLTDHHGAGDKRLVFVNDSDRDLQLTIVRAAEQPWLSAADLACNQYFRDFFSAELIDADEDFAVRSLSFVFTDIRGSTELYERRGDSEAYNLVKQHFRIIEECVAKHRGAIVKTIGDAVMATYTTPTDALASVFEMHDSFAAFNVDDVGRDDVIIKVGIHEGPCIAVTSNDRVDYFGRTVNLTARVQGLSKGGDVMISESTATDQAVAAMLEASGAELSRFDAELKGIPGPIGIVQVHHVDA